MPSANTRHRFTPECLKIEMGACVVGSKKTKKQEIAPKAVPNPQQKGPGRDPRAPKRTQIATKIPKKASRGVPGGGPGTHWVPLGAAGRKKRQNKRYSPGRGA